MALTEENVFAKNDVFPSWFANAIQRFLSTSAPSFQLTKQDATHVQVTAAAADGAAVIAIAGHWRWIEATISRAHPGGAAGTWDIFVVAANNVIEAGGKDATNRAFALRIVKSGETPTPEAGVADIFRKVGSLEWSGTEITRVDQTVPAMATHAHRHAAGQPDALAPADIGALKAANSLSDVGSAATARSNLSVFSAAEASAEIAAANAAEKAAREAADALKANLASPGLTGTPTAPTAAAGTNTTQLATTACACAERRRGDTPMTAERSAGLTHTSTYTTLFDTESVDRLLGAAHRELESDYLRRKEYVSKRDQTAIEARLQMLRSTWTVLLDRSTQ